MSGSTDQVFKCATDLLEARRRLQPTGFIGLGFAKSDSLEGPQLESILLNNNPPSVFALIASDLVPRLPIKKNLSICIPSFDFAHMLHSFLYSFAIAIEKSGANYTEVTITILKKNEAERKIKNLIKPFFLGSEVSIIWPCS